MSKNHSQVNRPVSYSEVGTLVPGDIKFPESGYNAFKFYFIGDELSFLMGQVLTIIDAVISPSIETERNKAVKDLVRGKFSERQENFMQLAYRKEEPVNSGHHPRCVWEDGLIPYGKTNDETKYSFNW